MESMESQEAGFPPSHTPLEIPSGLPHAHDLDDERGIQEQEQRPVINTDSSPQHRKGFVTDVPGPKCNEGSDTLSDAIQRRLHQAVKDRSCFIEYTADRSRGLPCAL
jgi:hypothetical protein